MRRLVPRAKLRGNIDDEDEEEDEKEEEEEEEGGSLTENKKRNKMKKLKTSCALFPVSNRLTLIDVVPHIMTNRLAYY